MKKDRKSKKRKIMSAIDREQAALRKLREIVEEIPNRLSVSLTIIDRFLEDRGKAYGALCDALEYRFSREALTKYGKRAKVKRKSG